LKCDQEYWEEYFTTPKQLRFPQEMIIRFFHGMNFNIGANVLDLGCGNGVNGIYAERLGLNVTYFDYSENAIQKAKEKTEKGIVIHSAIEALNEMVKANSYDSVISTSVLYHLSKKQLNQTILEIHNKLKKGGVFFGNFIASTDPLVKKVSKKMIFIIYIMSHGLLLEITILKIRKLFLRISPIMN